MSKRPTVALYQDTRRSLDNGKFSISVRVTFKVVDRWVQKYYTTGHALSVAQWKTVKDGSARADDLRNIRKAIMAKEAEAVKIIDDAPFISLETFDAIFTGRQTKSAMVFPLFTEIFSKMKLNDQVKSAQLYEHAMDALLEYGGEGLTLNVIDKDFLKGFESWMRKSRKLITVTGKEIDKPGRSPSTIGIYLRNLRAVFNIAIERRIISSDLYPFGKKGYRIPSSRNIKKALTEAQKNILVKYVPQRPAQARAVDMWKFSYYCNGMNFSDMAYLKKENIAGDLLVYNRRKTLTTETENEQLKVTLRKEVLDILKRHNQRGYVFGVITDTMPAALQKRKIEEWIRKTNKAMKRICRDLELPFVKTSAARHTATTILLQAGTTVFEVQRKLGHSDPKTTERYANSLVTERDRQQTEAL